MTNDMTLEAASVLATVTELLAELERPGLTAEFDDRYQNLYTATTPDTLPEVDDKTFMTIWWALMEYKSKMEEALREYEHNPDLHEYPDTKRFIDNRPDNMEDQAFYYGSLAKVTSLLFQYTPRAQALSLY